MMLLKFPTYPIFHFRIAGYGNLSITQMGRIQALAARSFNNWEGLGKVSRNTLAKRTNSARLLSKFNCTALAKYYEQHSCTYEIIDNCDALFLDIYNIRPDSGQSIFIGHDALLLNGNLICKHYLDELKKHPNISFYPKTLINVDENISGCSIRIRHKITRYSGIVLATGRPERKKGIQLSSHPSKKYYQLHVQVHLKPDARQSEILPVLTFGDKQSTWGVPSIDGKYLILSASQFAFTESISESQSKELTEHLIHKVKAKFTHYETHVSSYYELPSALREETPYWALPREHNTISVDTCDASLFKCAPALSEDISNALLKEI